MILPDNAKCARVIAELDGDPELSQWEQDFISSNRGRTEFSDKQKHVVADLLEKYDV